MTEIALDFRSSTIGARADRLVAVDHARLSDEDLLERVARHRDGEAFDVLYRRYSRAVYAVVWRMVGDRARSEDAAQDAFVNVWRAASTYKRDRGSAVGWMFAIARNTAADVLRARVPVPAGEVPDRADPGPGPSESVASDMEAFKVHAAVDSLPEREREVIELAYFSGLSQSEVAEKLGLPLGTVKTRTRSALGRLSERLEAERVML
jgi:RNA polymerase sigma-70 factor, ECF subfamily